MAPSYLAGLLGEKHHQEAPEAGARCLLASVWHCGQACPSINKLAALRSPIAALEI